MASQLEGFPVLCVGFERPKDANQFEGIPCLAMWKQQFWLRSSIFLASSRGSVCLTSARGTVLCACAISSSCTHRMLDLQPCSVGLCETHSLTAERNFDLIVGGIGTCTSFDKEYGRGRWLWLGIIPLRDTSVATRRNFESEVQLGCQACLWESPCGSCDSMNS